MSASTQENISPNVRHLCGIIFFDEDPEEWILEIKWEHYFKKKKKKKMKPLHKLMWASCFSSYCQKKSLIQPQVWVRFISVCESEWYSFLKYSKIRTYSLNLWFDYIFRIKKYNLEYWVLLRLMGYKKKIIWWNIFTHYLLELILMITFWFQNIRLILSSRFLPVNQLIKLAITKQERFSKINHLIPL